MYKCLDCGCEFDDPNYIKESHGELYPHCPSCGGGNFTEIEDFKCDACFGIKESIDDHWCEECRAVVNTIMIQSIIKCLKKLGMKYKERHNIVRCYKDIFCGESPTHEEIEAKHLMCAVVDIATDRGCSIDTALEMAEEWTYNSENYI